ncbi:MAG: WbuC family cupin fold metalloprotein [Bacteroidales bacterium]|nr:WbuC family cupin fold metalloprotein [Bacteroidales bacterium]
MKRIDEKLIASVSIKAQQSSRLRMNLNFHDGDSDSCHRMLNAIEPGSYIQPHKHENPDKAEAFFSLKGRIAVVEFDDDGNITDSIILDPSRGNFGAEVLPRTWHMIFSLDEGSVAYEVKHGPYDVSIDKKFASWAPAEGDEGVDTYLEEIRKKVLD